jgi:hypothetical protein
MADDNIDPLTGAWESGFSIAELWGFRGPVVRSTDQIKAEHALIWGILGIVEYQVSKGAGHRYLRERLWKGDWVAIGVLDNGTENSELVRVPQFENAKFGRKRSAIGDDSIQYTNVRILHSALYSRLVSE